MFTVEKETASMLTRDGVRLDADVYRPIASGSFPVLLMRQPYGRAIASTVVYAHPSWYAAHGYIVVIQDVRGRGSSEGEFRLFAHEIADGEDTVQWVASLPGSTGAVGMYGFSYQGMTQLYAAVNRPSALKTICPAMIGYDLYREWAYENGAFCLQANLAWAIQLAAETARLQGKTIAHHTLATAGKNLPLSDLVPTRSGLLSSFEPDSFYFEWLNHPEPDSYWHHLSPQSYFAEVDLPMLHIGGWFDPFLRGTLHLYTEMAERSQWQQQLIVGAWAHLPWGRKAGAIDFGAEATSPCDLWQLSWFDHWLKGKETGILERPPVWLFEMGSNQWRGGSSWNERQPTPFYLSSTGLANIDDRDGILTPTPPDSPASSPPDTIVHDPWRPVSALGGHATIPAGMFDRSAIDSRTDVLTYTSEPFTTAIHLVGDIHLEIECQADMPSFDLCAVLSDVQPNGGVYNFSQGYIHLPAEAGSCPRTIVLPLQPTCICIQPGHALRLSISAACFPAYPVNPGTGQLVGETRLIDQQIITITLQTNGDRPAQIRLPIVPA
ncbi:CocE/NonD family hydrolase [Pantanalinema rosaneae CENA516]|uniref:CocE/NonD family hydrolase n=1 Tax=Pantanalinema rosaneae TaxID=1620701 RepID=UPI003D6EE3A7